MAGFTLIADLVASGKEFGVFDFYLPFVIMFAVFWAVLTKIKLFGDPYGKDKKQARVAKFVNLVIALGASLYILANTEMGVAFATFLSGLFGGVFMVMLTIIAFVAVLFVFYAVSRGEDPFEGETVKKDWRMLSTLVVLAAVVFSLSVYISSSGTALFPGLTLPGLEVPSLPTVVLPSINLTAPELSIIFMVVATALIILYVIK